MSQEASVVGLGPPGITVMAAMSESTLSSLPLTHAWKYYIFFS